MAAVNAARISALASRALGRGAGTALPGLIATKLDPNIIGDLAAQLPSGTLIISGTNGKTTTSRILAGILVDAGYFPVRNESGSNLDRGLASSLIRETGLTGNIDAPMRTIGLFEIDEAALPDLLTAVRPSTLLLLDLFRDQLDRYGEVATVAGLWKSAIASLPRRTSLVANADDPLIADVTSSAQLPVTYFGIQSAEREDTGTEHASDVKACPRCGGRISYERTFLGHLGHYRCDSCGFARPAVTVQASEVRLDGINGSVFRLTTNGESTEVALPLPGMYNVYNALAAASVATSLGVLMGEVALSLARATPAFGRMERLEIEGRQVYLALAKNPVGLNEVIRTIAHDGGALHLMIMLNDDIADGRDVSWIWDADIEMLAGTVAHVVFSGYRAEDIALRFKYAAVIEVPDHRQWSLEHDTERAFRAALDSTPSGARLFIVPTYTAMLDIRSKLARLGYVKQYWRE